MTKLAEILTGPETWCQGRYSTNIGPERFCLVGALIRMGFLAGSDALHREYHRLNRLLGSGREVCQWNDTLGRTWDEVATVVDAYDRDRMLNP